jgi:hypothetical protein
VVGRPSGCRRTQRPPREDAEGSEVVTISRAPLAEDCILIRDRLRAGLRTLIFIRTCAMPELA